MGMFDSYEPDPPLRCPWCGAELAGWQGKGGPCSLFVWRQGFPAPLRQDFDEVWHLPEHERARIRLPPAFVFYTWCSSCGERADATGILRGETWTEVALGEHPARAPAPATDYGDGVRQCSVCAHVWWVEPAARVAWCPACRQLTELAVTE